MSSHLQRAKPRRGPSSAAINNCQRRRNRYCDPRDLSAAIESAAPPFDRRFQFGELADFVGPDNFAPGEKIEVLISRRFLRFAKGN